MTAGTQPSRALLIAAGALTQAMGAVCLVLSLASLPMAHDLKTGTSGVIASIIAALAAIVCGTLVWRGRLVALALAAGLDIGFGIGLPRGGSAIAAILRILPADDAGTAETLIIIAAITMFVAAVLCVIAVPSALKLRQWARDELSRDELSRDDVSDSAPTDKRPTLPKPSDTLKGVGTQKLMPTQVIRPVGQPAKYRPLIIAGVAVTLIAIGVIVITATTGSKPEVAVGTGSGSSVTKPLALVDAAVVAQADAAEPPRFEDFVTAFHDALKTPKLAALIDDKAFAFGVEANDLAEGPAPIVAQLSADLGGGGRVTVKFSQVANDGGVGWLAEELRVGDKTFVISAVAGVVDGAWKIFALHWAAAMPNETAYKLAREGNLAVPDAIPDAHDASDLAAAMKAAFASKPTFVEARSSRAEAFNFGSAGERLKGGDTIKRVFSKLDATIHLHDAVKVGIVGERGGWGAANVDFTEANRDGTEVTQTFRVLVAWIKEDAGWRMVQTQWSNPR